MTGLIIDLCVFAIILIFILIGIFKGLVHSLLSLFSSLFSLSISIWLAKPFSYVLVKIVNTNIWFESLLKKFANGTNSLNIFGINYPTSEVSQILTIVVSGIIIFLLISLVVFILEKIFSRIAKASIGFNLTNRLLGGVFGILKGIVVVCIILGIISLFGVIPGFINKLNGYISQSTVAKFIRDVVEDLIILVVKK